MPELPTEKERAEMYDPVHFIINVNDTPIRGWRTCVVERFGPHVELSNPSADGKVHRIRKHDPRMRMRITLSQDSPSIMFLRHLSANEQGFTAGVQDKSGTPDGATMWDCSIENESPITRNDGSADYEFSIVGLGAFNDEQTLP